MKEGCFVTWPLLPTFNVTELREELSSEENLIVTLPQLRQWCRLRTNVNVAWQDMQNGDSSSGIHLGRSANSDEMTQSH